MSKLVARVGQWHEQFFALVSYLQSPFLLFVRLYWGWQLAQSGWGKLHHLSNVAEFFGTLGLPMPAQMAVFIACVEFFGGIFLGLGLFSRITGFVLTVNMTMAYVIADREALLSFFSDPDKFIAAAPFAFLIVSMIVLIFGAGNINLPRQSDHICLWFRACEASEFSSSLIARSRVRRFSWSLNAPNPYGWLLLSRGVDRARFSVLFLPCSEGERNASESADRKRSHRHHDRTDLPAYAAEGHFDLGQIGC
jgi:putative oxidoreductase